MTDKANKRKGNEVALLSDKNVPNVLEILKAKIAEVKKLQETTRRAVGELPNGFGKIKDMNDVKQLIRAAAMIIQSKQVYDAGARAVGKNPDDYPFIIADSSEEDCLHDIKLQIAIVEQKETTEQLEEFEREMSTFLSEEDRKQQLVSKMKTFFTTNPVLADK